jgi:hypothetical protein
VAWQFDASTDQILGDGWSGTSFTIILWWYIDSDPNNFQNPILVYSNSGGGGSVRAGIGTTSDGTTMTTFDSAFLTQSAGAPGTGVWYCTALVGSTTSWTTYHGTNPASLTTVGPNTRTTVTAPGSIVLSLTAEWWRGRLANLKIYNRALSSGEVATEAAHYAAISSTNLIRRHTMLSSSLTNEQGTGANLTAGSTSVTVVAGPTALNEAVTVAASTSPASGQLTGTQSTTVEGALAATAPVTGAALTATETRTAALAGTSPLASAALTATETRTAALAALAPSPAAAALTGTVTDPGVLAALAPSPSSAALTAELGPALGLSATAPAAVGALTGQVGLGGAVAGVAPAAVGTLTATETRTGALAASTAVPFATLRPPLNLSLPLRLGTPIKTAGPSVATPVKTGSPGVATPTKLAGPRTGTPS